MTTIHECWLGDDCPEFDVDPIIVAARRVDAATEQTLRVRERGLAAMRAGSDPEGLTFNDLFDDYGRCAQNVRELVRELYRELNAAGVEDLELAHHEAYTKAVYRFSPR